MTPLQTAQLRAGEIRIRLSELAAETEFTDETRAELEALRKEYADNERRQAAAMIADDTPEPVENRNDSEGNEYRQLLNGAQFSNYVAAAMAGSGVGDGAERELNDHLGIAHNYFPLRMIAGPELEKRAAINGEAETSQGTWLDRIFHDTAAERVGISFRPVAAGVSAYPVTTGGGNPQQRGRTEEVTPITFAVTVTEIKPSRRAITATYSIEDDMRLPGLSDAIERDMRMAMSETVDRVCFNGDTGANEASGDVIGMRTHADVSEFTVTQAQKVSGVELLKKFLDYVDGSYASSLADVRVVTSVGANVLWYGDHSRGHSGQ